MQLRFRGPFSLHRRRRLYASLNMPLQAHAHAYASYASCLIVFRIPVRCFLSVLAQALPHALPYRLAEIAALALALVAQEAGRLDVCGTLVVGGGEEAYDAE